MFNRQAKARLFRLRAPHAVGQHNVRTLSPRPRAGGFCGTVVFVLFHVLRGEKDGFNVQKRPTIGPEQPIYPAEENLHAHLGEGRMRAHREKRLDVDFKGGRSVEYSFDLGRLGAVWWSRGATEAAPSPDIYHRDAGQPALHLARHQT